uniref:BamA/TamA family outer membrane protein n=1 Tax=Roseihalotalea indica TaxID=2867963 RepID=A0AA49GT70_9BACT|nr:BamA/TamA family outer membrane protein [Tunicatimonas sp. TK19036]
MIWNKQWTLAIIFLCWTTSSYAQEALFDLADRVIDLFSGEIQRSPEKPPLKWVVAPVVAYSPETSWQFGVGGSLLFPSSYDSTRTSIVEFALRYTLNNQILSSPEYTIFSPGERFIHRGELTYRQFPQFYYGIGNNTPAGNEELFSYTTFGVEHLSYRRIIQQLYAGLGFRYRATYNIELIPDGLLDQGDLEGAASYQSVGIDMGLIYDNRNNAMSTTSGTLAEFRQRFHRKAFGSDFNYAVGELDIRHYWQPLAHRNDILAVQLYGYFSYGDTPFIELAALGGDMIMRGYYEGRYRDNHLLAGQAEYRWHIWEKLGVVGFVGVGDVAKHLDGFSVPDLKPSVGAGLRYALIPEENLNIRVDFAVGQSTNNFYINISEAF